MKILMIGPVSFVGGVMIHINRLYDLFRNSHEYQFLFIDDSPPRISKGQYINIRKFKHLFKCIKYNSSADIIHIHSVHWLIRILNMTIAIVLNKKFIVTLHSFRLTKYQKLITFIILKKSSKIISVNNEISDILKQHGISSVVKEAFIPPNIEEEPEIPIDLKNEIDIQKKNKKILCANAFRLTPFDEKELYGLDQCIEVAKKAKENKLPIIIFFVVATIRDNDKLYNHFNNTIIQSELSEYIQIIPKSISFINLIKECDIVLRPTLSDGDALTVREALFLRKKVIASDIVNRPEGTKTYTTGDTESLYEKISIYIEAINTNYLDGEIQNNTADYINFYSNLYRNATTYAETL